MHLFAVTTDQDLHGRRRERTIGSMRRYLVSVVVGLAIAATFTAVHAGPASADSEHSFDGISFGWITHNGSEDEYAWVQGTYANLDRAGASLTSLVVCDNVFADELVIFRKPCTSGLRALVAQLISHHPAYINAGIWVEFRPHLTPHLIDGSYVPQTVPQP